MANMITTSLTWSQEDAAKYFLQPLFVSNNDLTHFDVMTDISGSSIKLDKYSALKDVTKAMGTACFEADGTQSTNSNVTLTLCRLEVEHAQQGHALFNHIKSQLMRQGISRNDLTGTMLMEMISKLLMDGIMRDFSTILWWGQTASGYGTQDLCNGIWEAVNNIPAAQQVTETGVVLTDLANMMAARTNELAASEQVMFVSRAFADAYKSALQAAGTHTAAYADLQGGINALRYNGVEMIVKPDWDVNIAQYGATLSSNGPSGVTKTKAAMILAKSAVAVGTDWQVQEVDMWYNRDCKENRFRMNYSLGVALKDNALAVTCCS
jgi:hypothetical protein